MGGPKACGSLLESVSSHALTKLLCEVVLVNGVVECIGLPLGLYFINYLTDQRRSSVLILEWHLAELPGVMLK